jgi:hypothetical protein
MLLAKSSPIVVIFMTDGSHFARERPKDIPADCLAVGNPARVVRRFVRVGVDGVAGAPDCEVVAGCTLSSPDAEYRASAHGAG